MDPRSVTRILVEWHRPDKPINPSFIVAHPQIILMLSSKLFIVVIFVSPLYYPFNKPQGICMKGRSEGCLLLGSRTETNLAIQVWN